MPGSLEQLAAIAETCANQVQRRPHAFRLAAFWLCGALLDEGETAEEPLAQSDETEATEPVEELSEAAKADRLDRELIDWPTIMATLPSAYHTTLLSIAQKYAAEIRADEDFPLEAYKALAASLAPQRIAVPGYLPGKAPFKDIRRTLLKGVLSDGDVAYTVVALWAVASTHLINELQDAAEARGLHFGKLTYRCNFEGIYRLPDQVPVLSAIAEEHSRHAAGMRVYDYQLAAHFISALQMTEAEWLAQQSQPQSVAADASEKLNQSDMSDSTSTPPADLETPAAPAQPIESPATERPADASESSPASGGRNLVPWC